VFAVAATKAGSTTLWAIDPLHQSWVDGGLAARCRKKWFSGGAAVDDEIRARFTPLLEAANSGLLESWEGHPRSALALIILLDQFSRTIHRGTAQAFAGDPMALRVSLHFISNGWDKHLSDHEKMFVYLPLEHSEADDMMRLSLKKNAEVTGLPMLLKFAGDHADILKRFGRYPHRNEVLGRKSTPEEIEYLKDAERYGQ
jgi:uncharacterized protein (DUF924 family)